MTSVTQWPDADRVDAALRAEINVALADFVAGLDGEDAVTGAVRYAVAAGGKRLRPVLSLAAMDAAGNAPGARSAQLLAACALELMHTYSLVHDDLPCMDDDDLRRGQPTAHRVYGSNAAMAAGVSLIPLACRALLDGALAMGVTRERSLLAVRALCRGAGAAGMVGGQILDLQSEGAPLEALALRRIHAMKTGALFGASLRVGAILGGAPPAGVEALGAFGEHLGMAFQITDDVLDVTGDSEALGKTTGKDLDSAKATFASQLGVPEARRAAAAEVDAALAELERAGLKSALLDRLARFAADRDR